MPSGDLCTLADVRAFLGGTSDNAVPVLQMLITNVSAWVQGFCERRFDGIYTFSWLTDGRGGSTLPLPEHPVVSVISVTVDGVGIPSSQWIADDRSITLLGGRFTRGRKNVVIVYTAGFPYVFAAGTDGAPDTITGLPQEIQFAAIETVALRYRRRDSLGKNSDGMAGQSTSYDNAMAPKDALSTLQKYKRNVPW